MNIKPEQVYVSRGGNYVMRIGIAYQVFTEDGHYIGEAFNQFDAFTLADRGTSIKDEE